MPISEILHQGKKVILVDYSECKKKQEMLDLAYELTGYLLAKPEKHFLILFDYTNAFLSSDFMKVAKEGRTKVYQTKSARGAALGVTGIKKVLLKGYNALSKGEGIQMFDTKEQALEYLVK